MQKLLKILLACDPPPVNSTTSDSVSQSQSLYLGRKSCFLCRKIIYLYFLFPKHGNIKKCEHNIENYVCASRLFLSIEPRKSTFSLVLRCTQIIQKNVFHFVGSVFIFWRKFISDRLSCYKVQCWIVKSYRKTFQKVSAHLTRGQSELKLHKILPTNLKFSVRRTCTVEFVSWTKDGNAKTLKRVSQIWALNYLKFVNCS